VEAHAQFLHRLREHVPHLHLVDRDRSTARLLGIGAVTGLASGLVLAAPLVVYDWAKASHSALELPMATASWLFGLDHFEQNGYRWWPIVVGALFLLAYWALQGIAFAALAERVYRVRTLVASVMLGAVWGFVSFMFFWYMLLPIARDGAPFRVTAAAGGFAAPNWVWILGFALSGLAAGAGYRLLAGRAAPQAAPAAVQQQVA